MYLVRIKPSIPCDSYNEFFKTRGWHKVDEEKAKWCATRRLNDLTPDAPLVFDVKTQNEAKVISVEEQKKAEPAGTVEEPIDFTAKPEPKGKPEPEQKPAAPKPDSKPEQKPEQKPEPKGKHEPEQRGKQEAAAGDGAPTGSSEPRR